MSLHESSLALNYPILTPLVSFISLFASFKAGLFHLLGTLTLTDIDHVRIMKCSASSTHKRGGLTGQSDPKHASVNDNGTPQNPNVESICLKTRRYKETHTRHARL